MDVEAKLQVREATSFILRPPNRITNECPGIAINESAINKIKDDLFSNISERQISAARTTRQILCRQPPTTDIVIKANLVPKFIAVLKANRHPELHYESAFVLANIAGGTSEHTDYVVKAGAVQPLIQMLNSRHPHIVEQVLRALGNIAGDGPLQRDEVINKGIISPLVVLARNHSSTKVLKTVAWTFANLCRSKTTPLAADVTRRCLSALAQLIKSGDVQVQVDVCQALSHVSDGPRDKIEDILRSGVVPRLVQLLDAESLEVVAPSLRTVGNIVTGDASQTQAVIDAGVLPLLTKLLQSPESSIVKEAAWTVSNIAAGTFEQTSMIADHPTMIPLLINVLKNGKFSCQREAIWALRNIAESGSTDLLAQLENAGILPAFCDLLSTKDRDNVGILLDVLETMLKADTQVRQADKVSLAIEECGGLKKIQELQSHEDIGIRDQANRIVDNYFSTKNSLNETLAESSLTFLRQQQLCDLKFLIGPAQEEFKCHSSFLAARSPVIREILLEKMTLNDGAKNGASEAIAVPDVDPEIFQLFLEFIYGDNCPDSIPQAIKLLQVAEKYNVRPLVQKCGQLISEGDIKLEDAIQTFTLARKHSLQDLINRAGDIMKREFVSLSKQDTFREIDEETLIYLVKKDDLPIAESELFETVCRWASHQRAQSDDKDAGYATALKNIIPLIRFPLMTSAELATYVYPKEILSKGDLVDIFVYLNSQSNEELRQEVTKRLKFSTVPREREVELTVQLYESIPPVKAYNFEAGEPCDRNETEDLEFIFKSKNSSNKDPEQTCAKLVALLLQAPEMRELQDSAVMEETKECKIHLTIEQVDPTKDANSEKVFAKECILMSGCQSEVVLQPHFMLRDGSKYRIRVVYPVGGIRNPELLPAKMPSKLQPLPSFQLKSCSGDSTLVEEFGLESMEVKSRSRTGEDNCLTVSLKFVRGLKLLAKQGLQAE